MIATAFSEVRIHSLKAEFWAASTRGVISTFVLRSSEVPRFPDLDVVGDPAPQEHDRDPEENGRDSNDTRPARRNGICRAGRCADDTAERQRANDADR